MSMVLSLHSDRELMLSCAGDVFEPVYLSCSKGTEEGPGDFFQAVLISLI